MSSTNILNQFIEKNPLTVMTRCIVDSIVSDQFDELFEQAWSEEAPTTTKAVQKWHSRIHCKTAKK